MAAHKQGGYRAAGWLLIWILLAACREKAKTLPATATPAPTEAAAATLAVTDLPVEPDALPVQMNPGRGRINGVAVSPDGTMVAVASNLGLALYRLDTLELVRLFEGHTRPVWSVAWSPDGQQLASGGEDGTVRTWGVSSGREAGQFLGHVGVVMSVAWSPDGRQLASSSLDSVIRLWDVGSGEVAQTLAGHRYGVNSVAWSPDGRQLASGSWDKTVRLWDSQSGQETEALDVGVVIRSVAWSPNGARLATAGGMAGSSLQVWDVGSGELLQTLAGHSRVVLHVAWSPDGRRLASAGNDATVRVWDSATGQELNRLQGHTAAVLDVAWTPAGDRLASAGWDETVRVWVVEEVE